METYTRYDLCPHCKARIEIYSKESSIIDDTMLVTCNECNYTHTVGSVLDFWNKYHYLEDTD